MIPKEDKNDRAFRMMVSCFVMIQGMLYRKSKVGPYLRYLEDHKATKILKDIHEGNCGNHSGGGGGGRSLCYKVLRTGYWWTTMKIDVFLHGQKCDACQIHNNILHQPAEPLHHIISPWSFMKWGMDIIGKLP